MKEMEEHIRIVTEKGQVTIPSTMPLEDTFGSVTPYSQPENFQSLRNIAVEEHVEKAIAEMRD